MPETYRAAVIGLGNIAWKFGVNRKNGDPLSHVEAFVNNPSVTIVGGCSDKKGDRDGFGKRYSVPVYADACAMISELRPDIVSICSPTEKHFEHLKYCIEAEVPMAWLEKPPASTLDDLRGLINMRETAAGKTTVLVNYMRRYLPSFQKLKGLVEHGDMGKPLRVNINYSRGLELNGSHFIDVGFFINGDVDVASAGPVFHCGSLENPSFAVTFKNGLSMVVSGTDAGYHNLDISVTFERGRASILYGGMETVMEEKIEHELFPGFFRLSKMDSGVLGPAGFDGAFSSALADLIASHEKGGHPKSNLHTSFRTMALIDVIREKKPLAAC